MHRKLCVLPWVICTVSLEIKTEGGAIHFDRCTEVSRGHSSPAKRDEGRNGMRGLVGGIGRRRYTGAQNVVAWPLWLDSGLLSCSI